MRPNNALRELSMMLTENRSVNRRSTNKQSRRLMLESYLSEEDFAPEMMGHPAQGVRDEMGDEGPRFPKDMDDQGKEEQLDKDFPMEGHFGGKGDEMAEEQGILPIKNEIDQIRQIALKTIAKLAENPVSEAYQMMKKIWMTCDKAIESALQPEEEDNKKKRY